MLLLGTTLGLLLPVTLLAQNARVPGVNLPAQTVKVSEPIEIGDLKNQLELDLTVTPSVELGDPRVYVDAVLSEPALYKKLLGAFKSSDESGCSTIYRQGEGPRAFEAQLCEIRKLSLDFDKEKRAGRLRARARMRAGLGAALGEPTERGIELRTSIGFSEGSVVLRPTGLTIEGLPPEASEPLLAEFGDFSFFLHDCLKGSDLAIEDMRFREGKNEATIRASSRMADSFRILGCLAQEGLIDWQGSR